MADILGRWSGYEDMRNDWFESQYKYEANSDGVRNIPDSFPKEEELLFASYGGGSYEGDATIVWVRDGKLYEAHGSHCSCYGLEGQFVPEETSVEVLEKKGRKENEHDYYYFLYEHDAPAYEEYWKMVDSLRAKEK